MTQVVEILLVDDEARNLDALEAILSDPAYRLIRAENADLALKLLLEHDVAAIVLDIKMPGVSGFELAHIIKGSKRFRQIPIVFLTAHMLEEQDVATGYGVGAVDYLTKPVNPQILRHKISVFAELFRKTRALAELNEKLEARVAERTAELERSEEALRAAARQKDAFLATLAHELRNPLAPLRTGVDFLQRAEPRSVGSDRILTAMSRQLDHMVRLIDDLLDVSRITRGTLELKTAPADVMAIVTNEVEAHRPSFEQRRITLDVAPTGSVHAVLDPTRAAQIVGNLLHNASKFTPSGGRVRVEVGTEGDEVVIQVIDSGIGLAPEQLERVFEMFVRFESPGVATAGLGIGLALSRRLAELQGGRLTASSPGPGKGSTFRLALPVARGVIALPPTTNLSAPMTRSAALDVVVIEDNVDVGDALVMLLEGLGHRVHLARSGLRGVELVQASRPEVVLCDVGLPDIDGMEVCRRLRTLPLARTPLMVALTGWGMEEDRKKTRSAGFDHHLVKPVAFDALSAILDRALAARTTQRPTLSLVTEDADRAPLVHEA